MTHIKCTTNRHKTEIVQLHFHTMDSIFIWQDLNENIFFIQVQLTSQLVSTSFFLLFSVVQ
jgi:hypothetical protein